MAAHFSIQQASGHTPSPDEVIAAIAKRQHGLVTLIQLLRAGLVHSQIARRVASGRLHRVHRGVYAVGHTDLSREAHWHAATLAAGEGAALGLLSAGTLHEISRFRSPLIAVLSPRRRRLEGVQIHRYRTLDPRDAMARANGRRNLHVLDKAIALYNAGSAGTRSGAEDAFLRLDLPEPLVNTDLHGFEVDFHWPDLKLAVEIDGPHHGRPRDRDADARQDRALQAAGYKTIRFTDEDVYRRLDHIREALGYR